VFKRCGSDRKISFVSTSVLNHRFCFIFLQGRNFHFRLFRVSPMHRHRIMPQGFLGKSLWITTGFCPFCAGVTVTVKGYTLNAQSNTTLMKLGCLCCQISIKALAILVVPARASRRVKKPVQYPGPSTVISPSRQLRK